MMNLSASHPKLKPWDTVCRPPTADLCLAPAQFRTLQKGTARRRQIKPALQEVSGHDFSRTAKLQQITGALQAAEKLNFPERTKNGSRQNAPGTIREAWLMVLYPPIFTHLPFIRSFSAACLAVPFQNATDSNVS
jgi:hypothetical protein